MSNQKSNIIQSFGQFFQFFQSPYWIFYIVGGIGVVNFALKFWIILPHEELIVVFCFFSFLGFVTINYGQLLEASLTQKNTELKNLFFQGLNQRKEFIRTNILVAKKEAGLIELSQKVRLWAKDLASVLPEKSKTFIQAELWNDASEKTKYYSQLSNNHQALIQYGLIKELRPGVSLKLLTYHLLGAPNGRQPLFAKTAQLGEGSKKDKKASPKK